MGWQGIAVILGTMLILSSLGFSVNAYAAGKLSIDIIKVAKQISDNKANGDTFSIKVTNTGDKAIEKVKASNSGQISLWFKSFDSGERTIGPGEHVEYLFRVDPPDGTKAGKYPGTITFSGKDVSSTSIPVTITVPSRNSWTVQDQRICTGSWSVEDCSKNTVEKNEEFRFKVKVYNKGNGVVTDLKGSIVIPSGFQIVDSSIKQTRSSLYKYGDTTEFEWKIKATDAAKGKSVSIKAKIQSNLGAKEVSKNIRVDA